MESNGVSWSRGPIIGRGSFGSVFLAISKKPKSSCFPPVMAVKSAELSASASLQKEQEILRNLHGCSYIVECFGEETTLGENGEMVYNMLLEYAYGGTLGDIIKKSHCGLPEGDVRRYTRSILVGLCHVHDYGYVHCDVKPDNILLMPTSTEKFVAKVGDLGLAKRARQRKKQRIDPCLRGTPLYLAPETVVDHVQEASSDIWALGCVVLEMLTGKKAWDVNGNMGIEELLCLIGNEFSLPEIPTGISKEARDFLKGCFVRKPMFRFTAEMLLNTPFVQGLKEEFEVLEENLSGKESLCDADAELRSSSCLDASSSFLLEEDCLLFSCPENLEEENCGVDEAAESRIKIIKCTRSTIIFEDPYLVEALTKPVQQSSSVFANPVDTR